MAWVKIDDQIADHPKIIRAGPLAGWLFVCGLTYCARHMTDGFIPDGQVRRLADIKNARTIAGRLVDAGLWERVAGGYIVHDYLKYQPTRDEILSEREAKHDAKVRAGRAGGLAKALAHSKHAANGVLKQNLAPSRPIPVKDPIPSGSTPPDPPLAGGAGSPNSRRRRQRADETPICSCEQRREWLKVNRNTDPNCDIHGDVREVP